MKTSIVVLNRYLDSLYSNLTQNQKSAEKMEKMIEAVHERRSEESSRLAPMRPQLDDLIAKTKELGKQVSSFSFHSVVRILINALKFRIIFH